ncbi:MAG: DUF4346 domain-containing protein [archaeon]
MNWTEVKDRTGEEWEMDPHSYVLIRYKDGFLEVSIMEVQEEHRKGGFVKEQKTKANYKGKHPKDLYYKILKDGHITNLQHAAYLGSELEKAYIAMKKGLKYVQDSELDF